MPNPTALFGSLAGIAAWSILSSGAVPEMHEKKRGGGIVVLEPGTDEPQFPGLRFQYYPENIQDSKGVNYSQKQVPGGSIPLYQWISGAERTISFSTTFSSDVDLSLDTEYQSEVKSLGIEDRNVDVAAAILWLRSLMMPSYVKVNMVVKTFPPPKLLLWFLNSGIGMAGGVRPSKMTGFDQDAVLCVMTQCDVEYKAMFPSGTPRLATVQLAFAEVPQVKGIVEFPGDYYVPDTVLQQSISEGIDGPTGEVAGGYNLRPKE